MNIAIQYPVQKTGFVQSKTKKIVKNVAFGQNINNQNMTRASLVDKNHNKVLVKSNNVAFKGLPASINHPLEAKIASLMQVLKHGELIVISDTAHNAKKGLTSSVKSLNNFVKKVFIIEDKDIGGTVAIHKSDNGLNNLTNLSEDPIFVQGENQAGAKSMFFARKNETMLIVNNDLVRVGGKTFDFKDDVETDLEFIRKDIKVLDFSNKDKADLDKINLKHFKQIDNIEDPVNLPKKITFADVGGQDNAISDLKKAILYPIKYPEAFKNTILNKGTILTGGPGTGKSLLAEAAGNESGAHFIKLNGLELESKWVGESEENWRGLFDEAKKKQPCVIFIDEFDAVAKKREGSSQSRYDDKVVNQILTLMSDLEKSKDNVFVVVATNKLDLLDDAIIRSGRFGKHIAVEKPNLKGCKSIFDIHSKNKPLSEKVDKDEFAKKLFDAKTSGADISHIVNEANQNAFNRAGIFEKMENNTFKEEDIDNLKLEPEDFDKALDDFKAQSSLKGDKKEDIPPVGYKIKLQDTK